MEMRNVLYISNGSFQKRDLITKYGQQIQRRSNAPILIWKVGIGLSIGHHSMKIDKYQRINISDSYANE